jgi:molybdopterin-dependent oxidoreductase alpha subunit
MSDHADPPRSHTSPAAAQPPATLTGLRLTPVPTKAGGWGAALSSLKFAAAAMHPLRAARLLLQMNQREGFDCPGCAWPEPTHRSVFEFCENGAKAVAEEATERRCTPEFLASRTVQELAVQSDLWLGQQGRLTHPVILHPDSKYYEPVTWDDAFDLIAQHLQHLSHPDEAAFYTSGRTSNEAAFLYQLFVRQFGTNNLPDCSNLCHESSGVALGQTLGVGKGTVQLSDFEQAGAIFVIGQNPGTNHPRMLSTLQAAARRGCRIVSINPLREPGLDHFVHPQEPWEMAGDGTRLAELFLRVRIGGDVAALQAIAKDVLEDGRGVDHDFIARHTDGFSTWSQHIQTLDWNMLLHESGLDRLAVRRAADIWRSAEGVICTWAMGLTQQPNAVANIQEIVNLLLLGGHMGRPGAGACPVRGHSNVQGDRTMGIVERPPAWSAALGQRYRFEPPVRHGHDVVGTIAAMQSGAVKVLVAMGGNFLSASPDTEATAAALRRCDLTVHVSTKLNRAHLVTGRTALILPCLGRTEHDPAGFVTVEDSMSVVHASRGRLPPASPHLLAEPMIVARLAAAVLGERSHVPWLDWVTDYDRIRAEIAAIVPDFHDFNARVRQPGGFVLRNAAREREFRTTTGKARFTVHHQPSLDLPAGQLRLMTLRSHDQYNTTIYGLDDRYRGIRGERRVLLLNPDDLRERHLTPGTLVDVTSHWQDGVRTVQGFIALAYDIPRGNAAGYFPECNALVPLQHIAAGSRTPASKSLAISIHAAA